MIFLNQLSSPHLETLPLTAIIKTALCVGAGGSSGSLADKPILRNPQGQLLIPASQLKGRLRHECEKITQALGWDTNCAPKPVTLCPSTVATQFSSQYTIPNYRSYHCLTSQIFGDPILPSRILVDDLICSTPAADLPEVLRSRVTLNRARCTAEERKLYLLETSPVQAELEFTGAIHFLSDPYQFPFALPLITAALHHIHALGGSKSAGLGWLIWKELPKISTEFDWSTLLPPIATSLEPGKPS